LNANPVLKSEFLQVAYQLFLRFRQPMTSVELVDRGIHEGLFSDKRAGKTPHQTMKSKLSVHIRRNGSASIFVRTAPGRYYLRELQSAQIQKKLPLFEISEATPAEIYNAEPIHVAPSRERVLVFPSGELDKLGRFQGIQRPVKKMSGKLLRPAVCHHIPRLNAEDDESHKQVLTYIIVTKGKRILAFRRGVFNRVEDYLRGSMCIGFGGHVSERDLTLFNVNRDMGVMDSAIRELSEELSLPERDQERLRALRGIEVLGVLNDDSSAVGRRHFAFILRYEVSDDPAWDRPARGEKSITQLRWLDLNSSALSTWQFEYWSQLCLREFFSKSVSTQPSFLIRRRKPLQPPHILVMLGEHGSGKTEATHLLAKEYGYREINSGRVLAGLLGLPPVTPKSRALFQRRALTFIRHPDGPARLAQAIWKEFESNPGDRILVDGIRQRSTLDQLRQIISKRRMGLLFVYTPPDVAFNFFKRSAVGQFSIFDFLKTRDAEVEADVRKMIEISDAVIYNWTGRLEFRRVIRRFLKELGVSGLRRGEK
jgi:predicted NUDIX family phosphoesterase